MAVKMLSMRPGVLALHSLIRLDLDALEVLPAAAEVEQG